MNNVAKVLIGVGVVGAVAVGAYVVSKKVKEETNDTPHEEGIEKKPNVIERIKTAAYKKAVRILAWVVLHQQKIEAVGAVLGVIGGVISIVNAVKEYAFGKKLHATLDKLLWHQEQFQESWNITIDNYNEQWHSVHEQLDVLQEAVKKGKKSA